MMLVNLYSGHHDEQKFNAFLVVFVLFGILVTTWLRIVPELVCLILVIMVVIPMFKMMKGFSIRDALGF